MCFSHSRISLKFHPLLYVFMSCHGRRRWHQAQAPDHHMGFAWRRPRIHARRNKTCSTAGIGNILTAYYPQTLSFGLSVSNLFYMLPMYVAFVILYPSGNELYFVVWAFSQRVSHPQTFWALVPCPSVRCAGLSKKSLALKLWSRIRVKAPHSSLQDRILFLSCNGYITFYP